LCGDGVATANVLTQIDGNQRPSVCGNAPTGVVNFPPRNESLNFKNALEAKYRDGLRRPPGASAVDVEGDIVWIQEYLRYRVNGCTHGDAAQKVFQQISGGGIAPVCNAPPPPPPPAPNVTVLTVVEDNSCLGIVQSSGLDVFIDNVLVGVTKIGAPLVITVPFGTHTIRARYNLGFLPTTTITLTTATFTFTILCR